MLNPYFSRRGEDKELFIEEVALSLIAEEFKTPAYIYSKAGILAAFNSFQKAFQDISSLICVSVKANSNLSLLSLLAKSGAGFDVVSGGELKRVMIAYGNPKKTVFAGVGKTDEEIQFALKSGILMFNVESSEELYRIDEISKELSLPQPAPVALRVNPDVDAKTHPYISTGLEEHKFGIPLEEAGKIYHNFRSYPHLEFVGVDCHIGSMITDFGAFRDAFQKLRTLIREIKTEVTTLKYVDIGGGVGVSYRSGSDSPEVEKYAEIVKSNLGDLGMTLVLEPGRAIFANSALLLAKVVFTKHNRKKQFVIIDAGFNDLIRPALYQAYHQIEPVKYLSDRKPVEVDVVGPICESSDCFAKGRTIPELKRDDLLVFYSVGAYGFTMASNYMTRPRPSELLVNGNQIHEIRPRETIESLYESEVVSLEKLRGI